MPTWSRWVVDNKGFTDIRPDAGGDSTSIVQSL